MNAYQVALTFMVAVASSIYTSAFWIVNTLDKSDGILFGLSVVVAGFGSVAILVGSVAFIVTQFDKITGWKS